LFVTAAVDRVTSSYRIVEYRPKIPTLEMPNKGNVMTKKWNVLEMSRV
jgi:hypothetical protein